MILIDALFIANEGGAPNLLRYLIDNIKKLHKQEEFFLLVDERFQHDLSGFIHQRLKAGLIGRYKFYKSIKGRFRKVFCFANTPPPVKVDVPVDTYFHNQMLLESKKHLLDKRYLRYYIRYAFVKWFNGNTGNYIVQTPHMVEEITMADLKPAHCCKKYPFYQIKDVAGLPFDDRRQEFVYVSTASFYKNHIALLNAWEQLFNDGLSPVLHLTVQPSYSEVFLRIEELKVKGLNIINHGYVDPASLYSTCAFMIYPSLNESFGLSLVEGAKAGMKILAADVPYVHSVIKASAYFDPFNASSIAATVKGALQNNLPFPEILVEDKVDSLIEYILN